jgi:hypothetical protein
MNRFLLFIFFLAIISSVIAQEVPQTAVFSAVVRNSNNEIVVNSPIDVRLTFLEGGQYGTPVYCEVHRTATNSLGSMTVKLNRDVLSYGCNGTSVLSFEDIPWENGDYWMQVEYRTDTTGNFSVLGSLELASTIYAFVADKTLELVDVGFSAEGVHDRDVLGYNEDARQFEPVTIARDPDVSGLAEVLVVGNSAEGRQITDLSYPVAAQDAVTKSYLDSLESIYVDIVDSLGGIFTVYPEVPNGVHRNHEYVDLGLPSGTMWATCNIGASRPEDCGNYYAWGETRPKEVYNDSTYTYHEIAFTLQPNRDAATVNWGPGWRMPTKNDMVELMSNCAWRWTNINGVNGYIVRGFNGNSIFLPACGCRYNGSFAISKSTDRDGREGGSYWLSTMGTAPVNNEAGFVYAPYLFINQRLYLSYGATMDRSVGQTVRPVYNPEE